MEVSFKELQERVSAQGLTRRTYVSYVMLGALIVSGMALTLYILTLPHTFLSLVGSAIFFGFLTVQAGMLGHDFSHSQVCDSRRVNRIFGSLVWGLLCGLSQGRWYERHNAHHKHVNHEGLDPDLEIPFKFSSAQTERPSDFTKKYLRPHQHILFFVLVPTVSVTYIFWSFRYLFTKRDLESLFEGVLMTVHYGILLGVLFMALALPEAFLFLGVFLLSTGYYMGIAFAPNHKGKEVVSSAVETTWLDQIVLTRNLFASRFQFYLWGGLGYQVEHHLFPHVSRFQYPHIHRVVKAYCVEKGISYHETSWWGSMTEIYLSLKENREE